MDKNLEQMQLSLDECVIKAGEGDKVQSDVNLSDTPPWEDGKKDAEQNSNLSPKLQACVNKMEKQLDNPKPKEMPKIKVRKDASELIVITKAKDFVNYVITATGKIPKNFRFTFASKIQSLALDVIESLFRANAITVKRKDVASLNTRIEFQTRAVTDIKLLEYMVALALEQGAMLKKQFVNISKLGTEVSILIAKWKESDKRRFIG